MPAFFLTFRIFPTKKDRLSFIFVLLPGNRVFNVRIFLKYLLSETLFFVHFETNMAVLYYMLSEQSYHVLLDFAGRTDAGPEPVVRRGAHGMKRNIHHRSWRMMQQRISLP